MNILQIKKEANKMATIALLRHGQKVGENISTKGIESFLNDDKEPIKVIPFGVDKITDIWMGSDYGRTTQSMLAFLVANACACPENLHPVVSAMGSQEMVEMIGKDEFERLVPKHGNIKAFELALEETQLFKFVDNMTQALHGMFDQMVGSTGLMFGHMPLIDVLAHNFGAEIDKNGSDYLGGYVFTLENKQIIKAVPIMPEDLIVKKS